MYISYIKAGWQNFNEPAWRPNFSNGRQELAITAVRNIGHAANCCVVIITGGGVLSVAVKNPDHVPTADYLGRERRRVG